MNHRSLYYYSNNNNTMQYLYKRNSWTKNEIKLYLSYYDTWIDRKSTSTRTRKMEHTTSTLDTNSNTNYTNIDDRPTKKKRSLFDVYLAEVDMDRTTCTGSTNTADNTTTGSNSNALVSVVNNTPGKVTTTSRTESSESSSSLISYKTLVLYQQQEIDTLQCEIQHERTKQLLQEKKYNQTIKRYECKYNIVNDELIVIKDKYDTKSNEYNTTIQQLQNTIQQLQHTNRQYEIQLNDIQTNNTITTNKNMDETNLYKNKYTTVEQQIQYYKDNEIFYKNQLSNIQNDFTTYKQQYKIIQQEQLQKEYNTIMMKKDKNTTIEINNSNETNIVLEQREDDPLSTNTNTNTTNTNTTTTTTNNNKDIRTVRIQLAESLCSNRLLTNKYTTINKKYNDLIIKYEQSQLYAQRYNTIQTKYDLLCKQNETYKQQHQQWILFQKQLVQLLNTNTNANNSSTTTTTPGSKSNNMEIDNMDTNNNNNNTIDILISPPKNIQDIIQMIEQYQNDKIQYDDKISTLQETIHNNSIQLEELQNNYTLIQSSKITLTSELQTIQNLYYLEQQNNIQLSSLISLHIKEADKLRTILSSIDTTNNSNTKKNDNDSNNTGTIDSWIRKYRIIDSSYTSCKEKIIVLQEQITELQKQVTQVQSSNVQLQKEYDLLKIKYSKIHDALKNEKVKVTTIEQRMINAEKLSGIGYYNPNYTKVYHIQETPLIMSLKEEIIILQRQLEYYTTFQNKTNTTSTSTTTTGVTSTTGGSIGKGTSDGTGTATASVYKTPSTRPGDKRSHTGMTTTGGSGDTLVSTTTTTSTKSSGGVLLNPDKLTQRLKENFKEQIALFREGVYLLTGYKIDMITTTTTTGTGTGGSSTSTSTSKVSTTTDKPTFRIRSVYAEKEDDHLLFQWRSTTTTDSTTTNNTDSDDDDDNNNNDSKNPKATTSSLDLLNTSLAQVLSTTPAYQYMTNYNSIPAFLANVQLNLFDQQTHIVTAGT